MAISPVAFKINVADDVLERLHTRLWSTRFPVHNTNESSMVYKLLSYWREGFNWRDHEEILNGSNHFHVKIWGNQLHFIHEQSTSETAIPLLLIHGFPGSIYDFSDHISKLKENFHLIIPSIPGFGWSDEIKRESITGSVPSSTKLNSLQIGLIFHQLMESLNYKKYVVHGEDVGAKIATAMAIYLPSCIALHLKEPLITQPKAKDNPVKFCLSTLLGVKKEKQKLLEGISPKGALFECAITDSPVGLCTWFVDCYREPVDFDKKDKLLCNIMIYWITCSAMSATRVFFDLVQGEDKSRRTNTFCNLPTAVSLCNKDSLPMRWVGMHYNLRAWNLLEQNSNKAKESEIFCEILRSFFYDNINFYAPFDPTAVPPSLLPFDLSSTKILLLQTLLILLIAYLAAWIGIV